jgi:glycogen operon protein
LQDLVSYNQKHNEANGEENRDGTDNNRSWNCGAEGPTQDPEINALRARQKRNLLATLFLSQGVPMMLAGDAIGHSQLGNNNAYCQDNNISWIDWEQADADLLEFVQALIRLRKRHPVFRRRNFFQGRAIQGAEIQDIRWLLPDGREMTNEEWTRESAHCLGVFLAGEGLGEKDERGRPVTDDNFVMLLNPHHDQVPFRLPPAAQGSQWLRVIDTASPTRPKNNQQHAGGTDYLLQARSMALFLEARERRSPLAANGDS